MIDLVKVNKGEKPSFQPEKYEYCYKLVKDNQPLGFGTINEDKENGIFIFINKEQRGNGYGKILFSKILEEKKNIGYNEVKITFNKDNVPMQKIATDKGGMQTSSDENKVKYVFSLN